jgi:uncharacterized integral membrane protein
MKYVKVMLIILFVLLVIVVAVQNHEPMSAKVRFKIDLVFLKYQTAEMSLYLVTVLAFLVGVLASGLNGIAERFRSKRKIKALEMEAKEKDKELNSYRNLPVTAEEVGSETPSDLHETAMEK